MLSYKGQAVARMVPSRDTELWWLCYMLLHMAVPAQSTLAQPDHRVQTAWAKISIPLCFFHRALLDHWDMTHIAWSGVTVWVELVQVCSSDYSSGVRLSEYTCCYRRKLVSPSFSTNSSQVPSNVALSVLRCFVGMLRLWVLVRIPVDSVAAF